MCAARGIEVTGVTKCCCGEPAVALAMLRGGVCMLGDSRLENIQRMRGAGIEADVWLLRLPALSEIEAVVQLTQVSLNSDLTVIKALSAAAQRCGVRHGIILMIEVGDRREGVLPKDATSLAAAVESLSGVTLLGVGSNLSCLSGVMPTAANQQLIVDIAERVEHTIGRSLRWISGGHTGSLPWMDQDTLPMRINHLRIGEAILIGTEQNTLYQLPVPHQDAFTVSAEVIEIMTKPSLPDGPIGPDGFLRVREWSDRGPRLRAILAIGEQDLRVEGIYPKRSGVEIVGASSDHLVVDVTDAEPEVHLGEVLEFSAWYIAVATAWPNQLVRKSIIQGTSG